ncbi:RadC family protein [Desulfolithobacter dissulfuricans]|uniref:RadC family protein n=1 Tax=Desulfolithobacter dissulfuricans TaxID=2795293 RepID=UPI002279BEC9|nr:DNA repair protein RadC [Desulfolithobacter dissulfuricans]
MLYVQDQCGTYVPAPQEVVLAEAKRISSYRLRRGAEITTPDIAKAVIQQKLGSYQYEMFACLFLDTKHRVLAFTEMFRGSVNQATVHPREVVKEALRLNASAVILAHNHPSGDSTPSQSDIELTRKLKEILGVIDVRVLDHLVIGDDVAAFSELGLLQ